MASQRPTTGRRGRPPHPDILTPAEWRVLDLLREGLSNPEIAERLTLSRDTVKTHVAAILAKLGVASREEAAAWEPEAEAAREPQLRRWGFGLAGWLRPVTLGKAALVGASLVVLAGMGVLAWGVLRGSGEEKPASAVAGSPTPTSGPTGGPATLTPAPSPSPSVTILPNGEQISYIGPNGEIRLVNADGSNDHVFNDSACPPATTGMDFSAAWSPDGAFLAFFCPPETDLRRPLVIFGSDGEEFARFEDATDFIWSPDGNRLAYQTEEYAVRLLDVRNGQTRDAYDDALLLDWVGPDVLLVGLDFVLGEMATQFKAHLFNIASGETTAIPRFDNPGSHWISPDGSRAVLLTEQRDPGGGRGMVLYDFATAQETPIEGGYIGYPSQGVPRHQLAFSQDGGTIYWADASSVVWLAALDAPKAIRAGQVRAFFVAVSPSGLTASFEELPGGGSGKLVIDDASSGAHADLGIVSLSYAWRPAR